jgi:hypothetical protein
MTKDQYFEMCEMLGNEPKPEEVPVELDDFEDTVKQAFEIYGMLSDNWEFMAGNYLGKDYSIVFQLFDLYEILERPEQLLYLELIRYIDEARSEVIQQKVKNNIPEKTPAK